MSTRQKKKLRVPVFVLLCGVSWIIERANFLCAGYASMRGYASKLRLRVPVFCRVSWIIELPDVIVKQLLKIELHFHKARMEKAPGLFVLFGYL